MTQPPKATNSFRMYTERGFLIIATDWVVGSIMHRQVWSQTPCKTTLSHQAAIAFSHPLASALFYGRKTIVSWDLPYLASIEAGISYLQSVLQDLSGSWLSSASTKPLEIRVFHQINFWIASDWCSLSSLRFVKLFAYYSKIQQSYGFHHHLRTIR